MKKLTVEVIKEYYVHGNWNIKQVETAYKKKVITHEEYEEILKAKENV